MLFALLAFAMPAMGSEVEPSDSVAIAERTLLRERFDRLSCAAADSLLRTPLTNDEGLIAWEVSLQLAALAEMLAATHDTLYAARFVRLADAVAAARDSEQARIDELRHRASRAWGSTKYSQGKHGVWAVHTGLIAAPLAQFVAVVRADADLARIFAPAAERYLKVADEALHYHDSEFQPGPAPDEGRMLWFGESLPFNQQAVVGRAWLFLDLASGDPRCQVRATLLARFLSHRLRLTSDSAYAWPYRSPLRQASVDYEDVSHAALSADFMVLCSERGLVLTAEDLRRLERTFLNHVLVDGNRVADTIDGSVASGLYAGEALLWGRLARHSPAVRDRLLALYHAGVLPCARPGMELLGIAHLYAACSSGGRPSLVSEDTDADQR